MKLTSIAAVLLLVGCTGLAVHHHHDPDALWKIVSRCVPNQTKNHQPDPCAKVDLPGGYVILKDRRGPLQYLLMPTRKIPGIESAEILKPHAPNYFYDAWKSRIFMEQKYGASIPADQVALAVNSVSGRSQNQLHVHISCVRSDVKAQIQKQIGVISTEWKPLPGGLLNHPYFARRVRAGMLRHKSAFALLADDLPQAKGHMDQFGLAVVPVVSPHGVLSFVLLADQVNSKVGDRGFAEEVMDHSCGSVYAHH